MSSNGKQRRRLQPFVMDLKAQTFSNVNVEPGGVVDVTGTGPIAVFGANVDNFYRQPIEWRKKSFTYRCEDCGGPVFTQVKYVADKVMAYCTACSPVTPAQIGLAQDLLSE